MTKGLDLPKQITKFLVFNDNPKYLRYVFGKYGIYVESITSLASKMAHGQFHKPTLVLAKFDSEKQISLLLKGADERLQMRRLFKSVWKRPEAKDKIDAFINNCAKNLVNLAKGKTIRIYSKDGLELQQKFYDIFLKVNEGEKTDCKFDFDEYDVLFWIKRYVDANDKHWFITSVEGLPEQLPNPFAGTSKSKPYKPLA